jgi:hypothetical protein
MIRRLSNLAIFWKKEGRDSVKHFEFYLWSGALKLRSTRSTQTRLGPCEYLLSRKAEDVRAVKLYRRELALAELQQLIFVSDMRAYLEYSIPGRLGISYIKEHWAEIMAEVPPVA